MLATLVLGGAGAIAGCGSSRGTDPVARAAYQTANVAGYRLAATVAMTSSTVGQMRMTMNGHFDRHNRTGTVNADETVAGRRLHLTEVLQGLTLYMRTPGLASALQLPPGVQWLKLDLSRVLGALGISSLPAGPDPSQFVDYLRAVSSSTTKLGAATVRSVPTTHYHAVIDLKRYPSLAASSRRAAAQRAVSTLESALGGHTLPVDVWIDRNNLVRRLDLAFSECVANQHLRLQMSMEIFAYGQQASSPPPARFYDATPTLSSVLSKAKLGCSSVA
jgi:hypothetical protein